MTNNTTQQKTGTVTINGRVYTHRDKYGLIRVLDVIKSDSNEVVVAILENNEETIGHYYKADLAKFKLPATTTRRRELRDITAELAKGGVPWVRWAGEGKFWRISTQDISEETVRQWGNLGMFFSTNPFKENPTIIGPEITEEVKP